MTKRLLALIILTGWLPAVTSPAADRPADNLGKKIPAFSLPDPRTGKTVDLADLKDQKAVVVVFVGTQCPVNNFFLPHLKELHKEFADRGVTLLGINANTQDTAERIAAHAKEYDLPFPVLRDEGNVVADQFDAVRTPEAFVLDADRVIRYRGRIDDRYGIGKQRPRPTRRDLVEAVNEVLAGKPVTVAKTEVEGCYIGRAVTPKTDGAVTYAKHVARIIQKNCQECHRPNHIGPFAMMTYQDVTAWADTIREVVNEGRMPPWHADPQYGHFSNDRSLSKEDKATLLAWLDNGMPKGDDKDLPPPRQFVEGWRIGQPDAVFTMPEAFEVPAQTPKNGVPYKYFVVDPGFTEDKWVVRAEAKPGAPAVVHHIIIFISAPNEQFRPDALGNVLCGTAPGDMPMIMPPGKAKKIPAGSKLVFQMHYTPNGTAAEDRSSVGLVFAKDKPEHRVFTRPIVNQMFPRRFISIPPGDDNFKIEAEYTFRDDAHVISFMPHMHLRGKDFRIEAHFPDGKRETLLNIPRYDFGWQSVYRFVNPVAVPKGTKLLCTAHFDNSEKNPNNPDPTKKVFWGDQTWEEMMIGWTDYYFDKPAE